MWRESKYPLVFRIKKSKSEEEMICKKHPTSGLVQIGILPHSDSKIYNCYECFFSDGNLGKIKEENTFGYRCPACEEIIEGLPDIVEEEDGKATIEIYYCKNCGVRIGYSTKGGLNELLNEEKV